MTETPPPSDDPRALPFDPEYHCGAHPDAERGPCRARKGAGTNHVGVGRCRWHGGASPNAVAAAQEAQARQMARDAVVAYGLPRDIDPAQALLEEVARTAGTIDWLRMQIERVAGERPENLILGTQGVKRSSGPLGDVTVTEVGPGIHLWLKLYQEERRHLVRVCATALAAGVEERRVRLAEQQGSLLASVIRAVLADLDLTPAQQSRVGEVVPRHLRAVSG